MTSFTAKVAPAPRLVVFIVYPDIVLLDLVGPLQVFSHALDPRTGTNGYTCRVVSKEGGMIATNTVTDIGTLAFDDLGNQPVHTLVLVGGDGANTAMLDAHLICQISELAAKAHRVCSVCSGALVLAATGLLDGRRAVTHWEDCAQLATKFPNVSVEVDPIYIKDGAIWTSAGITAGMDMALAIVSEDLGRRAALHMARSMVTPMVRAGGQSQFSPNLGRQIADTTGQFETLHIWMNENLQNELTVVAMADKMGMSARSFARNYVKQMRTTPAKAVEAMRTQAARDLLETSNLSGKQIAAQCGFNDEERMRRAFMRLMNVSPSEYRQSFHTR